jgi:dipeptidyl aminopeptidase/acylaminoacyl peptidase
LRIRILLLLAAVLPGQLHAQNKKPLTIDQFVSMPTVGDPQLSPDGKLVAYTISTPSLEDNRSTSRIWLTDPATGETWQATTGAGSDRAPRWSPDGKTLGFISTREGGPQIWRLPARGGEPTKLTSFADGVGDFLWSPDGKGLLFWTSVKWPDSTEAEKRGGKYPTEAKIWTDLFYRHWDEWRVGLRQHVFRVSLPDGAVTDLTPIDRDVPTLALGGADVAISPVATEMAVVFNPDSNLASTTNNDIFVMGPDGSGRQGITNSAANDNSPLYSPDSRYIAYLAMSTPGFEADRQQLMVYERATGRRAAVTGKWDLSIQAFQWAPDSRSVIAEVEERGGHNLYRVEVPGGRTTPLVTGGLNTAVQIPVRGESMVFLRESATHPREVFISGLDGKRMKQLTKVHDAALKELDLPAMDTLRFVGAQGDSVFGWLIKPPAFDSTKQYPLIYLIHGGPQSAWLDQWHARWNYALFASRGYVVAAVNFHGSTGYGQVFTNSISKNWGGLPYEDLMKGVDVVSSLPYVDKDRIGAAGASYGGYMIYWMAGQTDRFKVLVAHDGILNPLSMTGTTEELWFPAWEFGGTQLSQVGRATMEKWSPANYLDKWKTPMLVVHGQLDYRVDLSEGLQAFTALKLRHVPAKFLYFPDEGHWVLGLRNRRLWWGTVLDWMDQYLRQDRPSS